MIKIISLLFRTFSKLKRISELKIAIKSGMKVGERTKFVGSQQFGSEPFLIQIGEDCLITDGVKFITHDGSIQVPLIAAGESFSDIYSKKSTFGKIVIGNNVFIGVGACILPGTTIGSNSIVAAGAVVKGSFTSNSVIGGNPAKYICSLDSYWNKNSNRILSINNDLSRKDQITIFLDGSI